MLTFLLEKLKQLKKKFITFLLINSSNDKFIDLYWRQGGHTLCPNDSFQVERIHQRLYRCTFGPLETCHRTKDSRSRRPFPIVLWRRWHQSGRLPGHRSWYPGTCRIQTSRLSWNGKNYHISFYGDRLIWAFLIPLKDRTGESDVYLGKQLLFSPPRGKVFCLHDRHGLMILVKN